MPGEDLGRVGVGLGVPGDAASERGLDTEVQAAHAGTQRADQQISSGHGAVRQCSCAIGGCSPCAVYVRPQSCTARCLPRSRDG